MPASELCANAKFFLSISIIVESMEMTPINQLTVHQLLSAYPPVVKVFIRYSPACIGCAFERFCTLEDVARHYNLPLAELTGAIEESIDRKENTNRRRKE